MTPLERETDEVLSFAVAALPPPPVTVLEVGAGDGRLAAKLAERGFRVTAIDLDGDAVAAARARGVEAIQADVLTFRHEPFDALLFTRSFHHVWPFEGAVAQARALVGAGGMVVLDEFAHDEVDLATAAWFYGVQAILEEAGALGPEPQRGHHHHHHDHHHHQQPHRHDATPLERWRGRHVHEPPLHGARAMVEALGGTFDTTRIERPSYLHRYFATRLAADDGGGRMFARIRALEEERVALGLLVPVGLRIVARSRDE